MSARLASVLSLLALIIAEPTTATSHRNLLAGRAAAADDNRAFVPYEALRPIVHNVTTPQPVTAPKPAARHKHLARRSALSTGHDQHIHINKRQVTDPKKAASDWENRLPKRATTSAVPVICQGTQVAYGQCGGLGFTGDTCCTSGWTCTYQDAYYSQCKPATSTCTNALSGQCGGSGWTGATCCPTGSACVAQSQWYSQCLIGATTPVPWVAPSTTTTTTTAAAVTTTMAATTTAATTSAAAPSTNPLVTVAAYGQCGGIGWTGGTVCVTGYTCTFSNSYYSQCIPAPVVVPITTTTPVAASATTTASASASSSPSTTCSGLVAAWGQCAGSGTTYCCPSGYYCAYQNPSYSQCLAVPAAGTPTVTTTTAAATTTTATTTKTSSAAATTSAAPAPAPTCSSVVNLLLNGGKCGGLAYIGPTCCPTGYTCQAQSLLTSTCVYTGKTCVVGGTGSDGCTTSVYTVSGSGLTLPLLKTFPAYGHVNYQAISCSQYTKGQTYLTPGSGWTPQGFGTNFDPNNNQPGGKYIGKNFYDWGLAAAAYPAGFCVTWVQYSEVNQHYGEGGQAPVCSSNCGK